MSGEQAITLFDLRSTLTPQAWSLHACRTRCVTLNLHWNSDQH